MFHFRKRSFVSVIHYIIVLFPYPCQDEKGNISRIFTFFHFFLPIHTIKKAPKHGVDYSKKKRNADLNVSFLPDFFKKIPCFYRFFANL